MVVTHFRRPQPTQQSGYYERSTASALLVPLLSSAILGVDVASHFRSSAGYEPFVRATAAALRDELAQLREALLDDYERHHGYISAAMQTRAVAALAAHEPLQAALTQARLQVRAGVGSANESVLCQPPAGVSIVTFWLELTWARGAVDL